MTAESGLTGTLRLLRLFLRRDRLVLPLWVLLLSLPLASVYVASIDSVYPDQQQRVNFVASVMASPAQRALYSNIYNDSVGAVRVVEGQRLSRADRRRGDPDGYSPHPR